MENYSFDNLPRAVEDLYKKIDLLFELISDLRSIPLPADDKGVMTVEQAADFLNLPVSTIYGKVCHREMPVYKKGKGCISTNQN